jgi:hypothetical protein
MHETPCEFKVNIECKYKYEWIVWELKYAPIEDSERIGEMDYNIIEKKAQVVHLKKLLEMRIARIKKSKPKGWEVAVKSMTSSLEAVQNELAMRKMYGNDWSKKRTNEPSR